MPFDYTEMADVADELVTDHGRAIKVLLSNSTLTDAAKPWRGPTKPFTAATTAGDVDAIGAFVNYRVRDYNSEIKRGDKMVVVAAKDKVDLSKYEGVRDTDGTTWRIVDAETIMPGSLRLLYIFQVRQ